MREERAEEPAGEQVEHSRAPLVGPPWWGHEEMLEQQQQDAGPAVLTSVPRDQRSLSHVLLQPLTWVSFSHQHLPCFRFPPGL